MTSNWNTDEDGRMIERQRDASFYLTVNKQHPSSDQACCSIQMWFIFYMQRALGCRSSLRRPKGAEVRDTVPRSDWCAARVL